MKHLIRACVCSLIAVSWAVAQQETPPKPAPSIQPTAEILMKAADKTQTKREEVSSEELKKFVEREIAKSAALPVTTTDHAPPKLQAPGGSLDEVKSNIVVVDGLVYLRMGDSIVPMIGSGCFSTQEENAARTKQAQIKFAAMQKAESGKTEPVKRN